MLVDAWVALDAEPRSKDGPKSDLYLTPTSKWCAVTVSIYMLFVCS